MTAGEVEAAMRVPGRKAAACWRSNISPRSLSGLQSKRASSSTRSWVRMV